MMIQEGREQLLRSRIDAYSEFNPDNPLLTFDDGFRSVDLNFPGCAVWSKRGLLLSARREEGLLFTIGGDVIIHTPQIATARLTFYDQEKNVRGLDLGRDRSIDVASVVLGHFMYTGLDTTPGQAITGLRACLQRSLGDGIILPT